MNPFFSKRRYQDDQQGNQRFQFSDQPIANHLVDQRDDQEEDLFPAAAGKRSRRFPAAESEDDHQEASHNDQFAFRMKSSMMKNRPAVLKTYAPIQVINAIKMLTQGRVDRTLLNARLTDDQIQEICQILEGNENKFAMMVQLYKNPCFANTMVLMAVDNNLEVEFSQATGHKFSPEFFERYFIGNYPDDSEIATRMLIRQVVDIDKVKEYIRPMQIDPELLKFREYSDIWAICLAQIGEYPRKDLILSCLLLIDSINNDGFGDIYLNLEIGKMFETLHDKQTVCTVVIQKLMEEKKYFRIGPILASGGWQVIDLSPVRQMMDQVDPVELFNSIPKKDDIEAMSWMLYYWNDKFTELVNLVDKNPDAYELCKTIVQMIRKFPDSLYSDSLDTKLHQIFGQNYQPFIHFLGFE